MPLLPLQERKVLVGCVKMCLVWDARYLGTWGRGRRRGVGQGESLGMEGTEGVGEETWGEEKGRAWDLKEQLVKAELFF